MYLVCKENPYFEETGKLIKDWCEQGVVMPTLEQRIKDAESLLSDVSSEQQMIDIYKALPGDLKQVKSIINLCAEIKLHYKTVE